MASGSLKKVISKIYKNARETDPTKRTFNPQDYPVNWNKAIKYINAKGKRLQFNTLFKSFYKKFYDEDVTSYLALGHKLPYSLKKGMKQYAKEKAKEAAKAQLEAEAATKQSFKEQEEVLPEG